MAQTTNPWAPIAAQVAETVQKKNAAYGDAFGKAGVVMRALYPDGVPPAKLDDALTVVRVIDKLFRIATDRDALGESPWADVLGYALLALERAQAQRAGDVRAAKIGPQGEIRVPPLSPEQRERVIREFARRPPPTEAGWTSTAAPGASVTAAPPPSRTETPQCTTVPGLVAEGTVRWSLCGLSAAAALDVLSGAALRPPLTASERRYLAGVVRGGIR